MERFAAGLTAAINTAMGSSCIYPKHAPQPIKEEHLLTGPLEPTNLYGPGDNFDLKTGHVLPALIRRFHEARRDGAPEVTVWGTGTPRREFLHVDDLAGACVFLMNAYDDPEIINVGVGEDISIGELAELVREVVGYEGRITYDTDKPDGTPRKLLDVSRINGLGWRASIGLREGVERTYEWFRARGTAPSVSR